MHDSASLLLRNSYQDKRFNFLRRYIRGEDTIGLEIGACHLPTVPMDFGACRFADFRTADEMSVLWNMDRKTICDVDYVINRSQSLPDQIPEKFDYVIACHVLEHVPDPIGYIIEASKLLKIGGKVFLAVPDQRMTPDKERPPVTLDHLLMDFRNKCRYPSVEHIMEFHRYCLEFENGRRLPIQEAYAYAVDYHDQGNADVHCHAWSDDLFYHQFSTLCENGFLGDISLEGFEKTPDGFNEFVAIFTNN